MSYLSNILNNCEEVSKYTVSNKTDTLGWRKQFEITLHLTFCKCCKNFAIQSAKMDKALSQISERLQEQSLMKADEQWKNKLKKELHTL